MQTCVTDRATTFPGRRPIFYYITDRRQLPDPSPTALLLQIRRAISWGVDFVQLREKDLPDRALFDLATRAVRLARGTPCRIIVNGRSDIAFASGAHGVHLPSTGLPAADLVPHLPKRFLLGVSTHSLPEARRAAASGADYLLLGPVFPTASKIGLGAPVGLQRLRRICSALPVPILGLGGIGPSAIAGILGAGAAGVAGIRLFQRELDSFTRADYRFPARTGGKPAVAASARFRGAPLRRRM